MPFPTELVVAPMEAVVRLEVAQPVDHVEHCEAEGEEGAGNLVNSEKNIFGMDYNIKITYIRLSILKRICSGWMTRPFISTLIGASDHII